MSKDELHYDNTHITFLEKLWGDGYMSPGGKKEINRLLNGLDLTEKKILDIGCGAGGITVSLVKDYGAKEVIGVDVEEDVVNSAIKRVVKNRLKDNIEILLISKSNLPFEDNCFDIVFSKDSFVHIPDKEKTFSQVFRVLKPGGHLWIQFGPAWFGPYGRHMSGTFRKDRPWVHLVLPEKTIMRCHSVLGNRDELVEKFKDKPGGLNKMGLYRFLRIIKKNNILIKNLKINPISEKLKILTYIPFMKELFIGSISTKLKKTSN